MSGKKYFSTLYGKSTCAQRMAVEDHGEFRLSLRQPPLFRDDDDFESWEFAVIIYLAGVPEKGIELYILSLLREETVKMFFTMGVCPTASAGHLENVSTVI
ncbi:hypothetical protein PHET_00386 [Paragonimus heterotremus]|uniref:Uncharacterized protein n=1 Tax=Paragonimus heterotremus TaxID=100268 RepID=A0A8J4WVA5_9TREM|nr:hypothetical protein PHET_00386 [Paragonimus heterotremus]